ncbi:unnamed protein product [Trichobilharzia regenti]|nr:unnamed protein product [Trichobilharzia regenti]
MPLPKDIDEAGIPWKPDRKEYKSTAVGYVTTYCYLFRLHEEIIDFFDYISPTPEEQFVREMVVARVKEVVYGLWPDCKVCLITLDLVPIVKMTDRETNLRVDISFNMKNSVKAAELILSYMKTYPCLPYLVFVLKQYLRRRGLNEVWTGGLSSYALILMCVSFLQVSLEILVTAITNLAHLIRLYNTT